MMEVENLISELGSLDNFIKHFPVFASAPNGIIKLRELIIERAVNGHFFHIDEGYWNKGVLENFISLEYGKNLPAKARNDEGGIPVYGSNGIVGCHDEFLISEPAIVVGRKGSAGALNIAEDAFWPTDVTYYVVPPKNIDLMFCYYWLRSLNLDELGQGIKPGLNRKQAYALEVKLPPLEEQKRIVAKVDELMALVDKLEAQQQAQANIVLQANVASINLLLNTSEEESFDESWNRVATHFNTLYGYTLPMPKGEGRQKKHLIGLENVKTLRRAILQLGVMGRFTSDWRSQFAKQHSVKSLLDKIQIQKQQLIDAKLIKKQKEYPSIKEEEKFYGVPDSWEWVRIRDFSSHYVDCPHDTPKYIDAGYPCIRAPDITENGLSLGKIRYVDEDEYIKRIRRLRPVKNDLVYIREGGRLGVAGLIKTDEQVCLGQRVMMLRFAEEISSKYMCFFLNAPITFSNIVGKTLGAASPHVNVRDIIAHPVPIPPLEEQAQIIVKVDELMRICDKLEEQLTDSYSDAETLMQATVKSLVA